MCISPKTGKLKGLLNSHGYIEAISRLGIYIAVEI
jgi:hypothetical protein